MHPTIPPSDLSRLMGLARACELADAAADVARSQLRLAVLTLCSDLGCSLEDIDAAVATTRTPTERIAAVAGA